MTTFWRQATAGTSYYRCELPARHLPGKVVEMGWKSIVPDGRGWAFPEQEGDVAVWQFPGSPSRYLMMRGMQQLGIRCIVDVDDNYLVQAPHSSAWRAKHERREDFHSHEVHRDCVEIADAVICSTEYLAEQYRPHNENVFVCRNAIDPVDWPWRRKDGDVFRIGWAASASHAPDFKLVRKALDWASRQPGVEVVMIGHDFGSGHRLVPWTDDLAEYRENLGQLDVGLCPLRDNEWTRCKSDVKALEYAMAGALPIVSPVEAYSRWDDFVVSENTPSGWLETARWAVKNRGLAAADARHARMGVLRIESEVAAWREALCES